MKQFLVIGLAASALAILGGSMAYAQDSSADSVTGLITATTALIAGLSGIVIAVLTKFSEGKQDNKMINDIIYWANQAKATDQWVLENQEKMKTVVSVVENLSPQAKEKLAASKADLQSLTADIIHTREEIDRLYDLVPRSATGPQVSKVE
jgi:hypothetical protein